MTARPISPRASLLVGFVAAAGGWAVVLAALAVAWPWMEVLAR